jgi:K+-sensing histidine kinase KdpD
MQSSESKTGTVLAVLRADAGDEATVAAAARLAALYDAPWHAVVVENAHTRRCGDRGFIARVRAQHGQYRACLRFGTLHAGMVSDRP